MPKINLLDAQTSNLIAAGEVVERPANVLKELLENAIDAKSSAITTEIRGGGIDFIRVSDNGVGMDKDDLALCIRRHATSKIQTGADLASIRTLGFRGEALAAISSTSRFTIFSKRREDTIGHQLTAEGEEVFPPEECGCADGTTIIVRDLFFNQPARRKFLKRAQTEASAILQYLQRLAVSHPEIAFKHSVDGAVKLQTVGNGKLADCIYSVYGSEFFDSLCQVEHREGALTVTGFITRPEMPRSNHAYQSFYINRRYVKSRTMQFALEDAYKSFCKSEKFPGCVLFLEIDPDRVDVNVHPAKLEVRFEDEKSVYLAVYHAVKNTLSSLSNRLARDEYQAMLEKARTTPSVSVPKISQTTPPPQVTSEVRSGTFSEKKFDLPLFSDAPSRGRSAFLSNEVPKSAETVKVNTASFYETTAEAPPSVPAPAEPPMEKVEPSVSETKPTHAHEPSVTAEQSKQPVEPTEQPEQLTLLAHEARENNPLVEEGVLRGVLFHAYLLYETRETVYLIDKHAAHERILYESLKKKHTGAGAQGLLEPLVLRFAPMEKAALAEHLPELGEAGFELEEFGEDSFLLRSVPIELIPLSGEAMGDLIAQTASELSLGGRAAGAKEKRFDRTLYSMACKAAVKAGIPSTDSDHEWIVQKLREIDNVTVCPHGRPVLVPFTKKQIEALFLR